MAPSLHASNFEEVIDQLLDLAKRSDLVLDFLELKKDVVRRVRISSVVVGHGCAFPHPGKPTPAMLAGPVIVVAKTPTAITCEGEPVQVANMFFLICAPTSHEQHSILLRLAGMVEATNLPTELARASDPKQMYEVLLASERQLVC